MSKEEKLNSTQTRLMESIGEIEADYKRDASLAFLSRKYFVSKPTIKTFLIEKGIYNDKTYIS